MINFKNEAYLVSVEEYIFPNLLSHKLLKHLKIYVGLKWGLPCKTQSWYVSSLWNKWVVTFMRDWLSWGICDSDFCLSWCHIFCPIANGWRRLAPLTLFSNFSKPFPFCRLLIEDSSDSQMGLLPRMIWRENCFQVNNHNVSTSLTQENTTLEFWNKPKRAERFLSLFSDNSYVLAWASKF